MAAMDFMHKQLISAAGRDALTSIGAGAGIGAGVGAANALVTGNDSLLGGATSGAMLGAAGGAAMRYAGTKYGANYASKVAGDKSANTGKLDFSMFSKKEDVSPFDFMSNSDSNNAALKKLSEAPVVKAQQKGAGTANAADNAKAAPVKTPGGPNINSEATAMVNEGNAKDAIDATKKIRAEQAAAKTSYQSAPLIGGGVNTGSKRGYGNRADTLAKRAKTDEVLANRKPTHGMEDYQDSGFMGNVPQHQLQYLSNTYAPKLNNDEIRKGVVAKNASKIREPGYTSKQEIDTQWNNRASAKEAQMDAMWESIGM